MRNLGCVNSSISGSCLLKLCRRTKFVVHIIWIFSTVRVDYSFAQDTESGPANISSFLYSSNESHLYNVASSKRGQSVIRSGVVSSMAAKSDDVVYFCVLVPSDDIWMFSLKRILPAVEMAVTKVIDMEMLPNNELKITMGDSRCNARGAIEAFEYYYIRKQVSAW